MIQKQFTPQPHASGLGLKLGFNFRLIRVPMDKCEAKI